MPYNNIKGVRFLRLRRAIGVQYESFGNNFKFWKKQQ